MRLVGYEVGENLLLGYAMRFFPRGLPWVIAAMVVPVVIMFAQQVQHRTKPAPKAPLPRVEVPVDPDPEEFWACGLGTHQDKQGHHCHCQEMVEEVHTEHMDHCKSLTDEKAYQACMNSLPEYCDVIKNSDLKHPVHSCKRSCNKNAICKCADCPSCHLPPLSPVEDPDQ